MTTYEACDEEARRIGEEIAADFMVQWQSQPHHWETICLSGLAHISFGLPMRDSLPHKLAESRNRDLELNKATETLQNALAQGEPPARIKQLIDEQYHQRILGTMINEWVGFTNRELQDRVAVVEVECVALNDLVLTGLPGESLSETGEWLRARSLGKKLIPVDQVNGYVGYLTSARSYDQGGYSYWGGWISREAEEILRKEALKLIEQVTA